MAAFKAERGTIQGWHVLAAMIAFFGVIFAVNGVFLVMALDTHTGIVSKQPYRKGLDYNRRIAADERQKELGWSGDVTIGAEGQSVQLVVTDRYGRPVPALAVTGFIGRPSTAQHDLEVVLREEPAPGTYVAALPTLPAGNWLVQFEARELKPSGDADVVYRVRKRIWLKR
ncbi:MAG: FixH family protein [Alphaproteobacteria bacterium]|nr:FixH family protein [Alphaproteobacteria bacterium]